ncbi:MAG: hypothetical protein JXB26_06800 [Candidatus Aminicenantes bacterium]|nr:hypothetical protein [Candidatus Aminicenantes bacterium]
MKKWVVYTFLGFILLTAACMTVVPEKQFMILNPDAPLNPSDPQNTWKDEDPILNLATYILLNGYGREQINFSIWNPVREMLLHRIVEIRDGREYLVAQEWVENRDTSYTILLRTQQGATFYPGGQYRLYIGTMAGDPEEFIWYYRYDFRLWENFPR